MTDNLAAQFDLGAESAASLKARLMERRREFSQAISAGGSRADFKIWQVSLMALEAALDVLDVARPTSTLSETNHPGGKR